MPDTKLSTNIKAIAALITAVGGLIVVLMQTGVFSKDDNNSQNNAMADQIAEVMSSEASDSEKMQSMLELLNTDKKKGDKHREDFKKNSEEQKKIVDDKVNKKAEKLARTEPAIIEKKIEKDVNEESVDELMALLLEYSESWKEEDKTIKKITGTWVNEDNTDLTYNIEQIGHELFVEEYFNYKGIPTVISTGFGLIDGNEIEFFYSNLDGNMGEAKLTLSPTGGLLSGTWKNTSNNLHGDVTLGRL